MDREYYLRGGIFTRVGDACRDIASKLGDNYPIDEISEFVISMDNQKKTELWRKRNAEQILRDGFVTGCTDRGLVFVTLCRIKGFPAAYVETLEEDFLINPAQGGKTRGHIFSDVCCRKNSFENGKWVPWDPGYGKTEKQENHHTVYIRDPGLKRGRYVELGKGLDFSEVHLYGLGQAISPKASLETIEDIREVAKKMRI